MVTIMKVVICDDIPEFLRIFRRKLDDQFARRDWPLQCEMFSSGKALLEQDLTDVHAVFIDIDMPGINGLDTARQLRARYDDLVIVFVTAFVQYAVDGYSAEALRYLLKDRLDEMLPGCLDAINEKVFTTQETTPIQTLSHSMTVRLRDILYFEGTPHRHSILHSYPQGTVECLGKLTDFDARLSQKGFLRIQKSFLVNMKYIEDMRNYSVLLTTGETLSTSRKTFRQLYTDYIKWKGHVI